MTGSSFSSSVDARLTELETRLSFQDNTINELNEVIITQQRRIVQLERAQALLKGQLRIMAPSLTVPASEETAPPHY